MRGCAYKSKIYYSILGKFGYDEISKELFRNENVYLMSLVDVQTEDYYPGLDFVSFIYKWLRQDTDMIRIAKVDVLDGGINVYKVLYSEDDALQINNKNKMVVYGLANNGDYCYVVLCQDLVQIKMRGSAS